MESKVETLLIFFKILYNTLFSIINYVILHRSKIDHYFYNIGNNISILQMRNIK